MLEVFDHCGGFYNNSATGGSGLFEDDILTIVVFVVDQVNVRSFGRSPWRLGLYQHHLQPVGKEEHMARDHLARLWCS